MKTFKLLFIIYLLIHSISIMANDNIPINPSSKFRLDIETFHLLQKQSFAGDANAANKIANYYNFYLTGDDNFYNACLWFYISAILGNETALHNFNYLTKRKKIDLNNLLAYIVTNIVPQEKNELLTNFVLYQYYIGTPKSEEYFNFLESKKIDTRLLKRYTLKNGKLTYLK